MEQEKVSQFIKDIRKKHKLTQKDFADKYGVTYQAVSKWENAKNIPDLLMLKQICKDFNVSLDDILGGEYEVSNSKKKKIIIISVVTILVLCLIGLIFINTINRNNDFNFKTISSSCNNFDLSGSVSYNKQKSAIHISNINYCGEEDDTLYDEIKCILYENNNKEKIEISSYIHNNPIKLKDFLEKVRFSIDNYNNVCKHYSDDSLELVISAKLDNKTINYDINLSVDENCN